MRAINFGPLQFRFADYFVSLTIFSPHFVQVIFIKDLIINKGTASMKWSICYLCVILLLLCSFVAPIAAEDINGGTVKYHATKRYDFQTLFASFAEDYPDWVNSIPTESEGQVALAFTIKNALFDTRTDEQVLPKQLRDAQAKAVYMQGPSTELKKIYLDLEEDEIVRQVDFMGRTFLISDEIESKPWKLTNKMTKILDYTCMGAEQNQDGKEILAYFTSEIPFPIGPDEFFGLPGLVLAVEVDGATAFLATSVELTLPAKESITEPKEGKSVTRVQFDNIVDEKTKEYIESKYDGNYHK
jgi:GLPGLI family protein